MVATARCACLMAAVLAAQVSIPLDLHRKFIVTARGSAGAMHDLTFLIDTGTSTSILDARVAQALALTGGPSTLATFSTLEAADQVEVPTMRLGPIQRTGMRVLVADLTGLKPTFGTAPDVIVGADFFRDERFTIDYTARRLHFGPAEGMAARVPLDPSTSHLIVRVTIDDTPLRLVVDTGSEVIALFEHRIPASWRRRAGSPVAAADFTGAVPLRPLIVSNLSIGDSTWLDQPTYLLAGNGPGRYDGVLGIRALNVPSVAFDLIDMTLSWRDDASLARPQELLPRASGDRATLRSSRQSGLTIR
jgi:predicted aspartyl protease